MLEAMNFNFLSTELKTGQKTEKRTLVVKIRYTYGGEIKSLLTIF